MLLFQKRFHAGLVDGSITLTFRRWGRPHVKPGGRYRVHPIGVVEVDALEEVPFGAVREADARRAGFTGLPELRAFLAELGPLRAATRVWKVGLHHAGQDDRVPLALEAGLTDADVDAIAARLAKLDARKPWTRETLSLIRKHPQIAASRLAAKLGRETLPFKVDVRKLKKLGLTMSFEVGYELSPRGKVFLARRKRW
ncbi:MAG: hypothetical protein U0229_11530 [Anaeromyxobacter sp.]